MEKDDTLRLRVNADLKAGLQKLAAKEQRKLSDYIRLELQKIVDNNKNK